MSRRTAVASTSAGRLQAAKRVAIEQAAMASFLELGYARSTTEVIAKRAQVSSRTLFKHFANKDVLFESCVFGMVQLAVEQLSALVQQSKATTAQAAVEEMIEAYASVTQTPMAAALSRLLVAELPHHPNLRAQVDSQLVGAVQAAYSARIAALHKGRLIVAPDAQRAAHDIICLVSGYVAYPSLFGVSSSPLALPKDKLVKHLVRAFFGLHPLPASPAPTSQSLGKAKRRSTKTFTSKAA
jgi:AcrR family transcriptional regulator